MLKEPPLKPIDDPSGTGTRDENREQFSKLLISLEICARTII